jgi:hypothetical protein
VIGIKRSEAYDILAAKYQEMEANTDGETTEEESK